MLGGLPDDTVGLANALSDKLKNSLWNQPGAPPLGVVVAGVNNSRGVLLGLHSSYAFDIAEFNPVVTGGLGDGTIFNYMDAQLRGLLVTPQDALDFLLLVGDLYALALPGLPRTSTVMRIAGQGSPELVPEDEITVAIARNVSRLSEFRTRVMDILL